MKEWVKCRIEALLAQEFYCSAQDLNGRKTVYTVHCHAAQPYIKILAYRNCVVVCTSEELHAKVTDILRGKNRDEIFELPLVYGQTIHYIPKDETDTGSNYADHTQGLLKSSGYEMQCLFDETISELSGLAGFENAIAFDEHGITSAKVACVAKAHQTIIGVAGASESVVNGVWEIGVDVMEEYRNAGMGTYLVRSLTSELLKKRIVPFYSASVTNIGSQMVAARSGYVPFWVDTFGTILDGSSAYDHMIGGLAAAFAQS